MKIEDLDKEYDKLQKKYGAKELSSIYNGGCTDKPDICFVFMNPTASNVAAVKDWPGRRYPWLGTKNIWKLFYQINYLDKEIHDKIQLFKAKDWDYEFCEKVYDNVRDKKIFITNLGKCTQVDARALPDEYLASYKKLLFKEISIIKPKIIITFGNQVSSIVLDEKISVSKMRKQYIEKKIDNELYKVYPVFYPVGNGFFNVDKAIEDIKWICKENSINCK